MEESRSEIWPFGGKSFTSYLSNRTTPSLTSLNRFLYDRFPIYRITFTSLLYLNLVVCSWRVLRENRNRQFFDLSGLSSLLVPYLAMGTNPPTSVPNYRLFWPCRKMKGNRSGFRVKPRQLHTTNPLAIANSLTVGCCGCCAMVSNGEQWLVVACNGWWLLVIAGGCGWQWSPLLY